jgi:hypothetical protein
MANQLFLRSMGDLIEGPVVYILSNAATDATVGLGGEFSGRAGSEGQINSVGAIGEMSDGVDNKIKNSEVNSREKGKITSKMQEENWLQRKIQEEIDRRLLENRIAHLEEKVRYMSSAGIIY